MRVKTFGLLLVAAMLAGFSLGCSGDKDKGINSNREKPKAEGRTVPARQKVVA